MEIFSFKKKPSIEGRPFRTAFSKDFLAAYQRGTMNYTYRGTPCLKNPIDLALYMKLIWEKKPATILEIGAYQMGSAQFFADLCRMYGLDTRVVSIDLHDPASMPQDDNISFMQVNALDLDSFAVAFDALPRPCLVIEDSAHTSEVTFAVMTWLKDRLERGEVLVIEDGVVEDMGIAHTLGGGPNHAVSRFFEQWPDSFRVMAEYADFFGANTTFNPNGYLEKL